MTMFVALDQNGRLATIEQAHRGLACHCTCVSCGEPVVARKGPIREHHFAHHSNKESCNIQRESLLHLFAKEVIANALGLQLPPLPGTHPANTDTSSWWGFERVIPEVPQLGFQPDLVADLKDGSQLFIEVAVTSFIGEEKLALIKSSGIKTVEIDLREVLLSKHPIPSEAVKDHILQQTHNKAWAYPETPPPVSTPSTTLQLPTAPVDLASPQSETKLVEYKFTIMGLWVSARILASGSIAVRSWSYNPQITELLKSWRNQLGGEYNPKYKNWIYYPHAKDAVLARLQELDQGL